MKKWIIVAVTLIMAAAAPQADAKDWKDFEPYLGIGAGSFKFDVNQSLDSRFVGFNNPNVTGFTVKGGVDIYKYFGLELRGLFTGTGTSSGTYKNTFTSFGLKISNGFSYLAKIQAPFDGGLRIYAAIGGSQASLSGSVSVLGTTVNIASNGSSGSYGGGLAYDADNGFSMEAEWMRYASDIRAVSLFAAYRF